MLLNICNIQITAGEKSDVDAITPANGKSRTDNPCGKCMFLISRHAGIEPVWSGAGRSNIKLPRLRLVVEETYVLVQHVTF